MVGPHWVAPLRQTPHRRIRKISNNVSKPARFILHPTDFSTESSVALAHAVRIAVNNKATLELLHVETDPAANEDDQDDVPDEDWNQFPSIRTMLETWRLIPSGDARSDVSDLGIEISEVVSYGADVPEAIAEYCQRRPIDMVVLSTSGRDGFASLLMPSTAERVANKVSNLSIPTLFVPKHSRGCVDVETGRVTMNHVLVPVDHELDAEEAVERGLRAMAAFGDEQADLSLLHVGAESDFPHVEIPDSSRNVRRISQQGDPATEILSVARDTKVNLIIMVTDGEQGLLDILRGTTTEKVLRHAPCPVLAIPAR